ncbi:hypothetical protein EJ05DRAFT_540195 [Pseudovirgaria hyperparasitica]|uniref:TFIIS N-terminal domain-containing protein n=1 Tax=Pseudovirgaria hyperparasitica TaxID=470096 RepID=A0A6A6W048_9PEZI|nr:uncharacterized protein EJ05DRAFT_540195 [Pseudovirgaria hyperparasitica]KAF2755466.1 hypothetical protein EJ05DRAFT_540195 [Pseudovirgaria hyperparasitica]
MDDIQTPPDDATVQTPVMPEGNADPGDPLGPDVEEENNPDAPEVFPQEDVELTGENEVDKDGEDSDNESVLSDVDEAQFEDFNPADIAIEDQPVALDDDLLGQIKVSKRKRGEDGEGGVQKKKKEGRREKPKNRKKRDEDHFSGGEELEGKRSRKKDRVRAATPVEDDTNLTPEERRRRALDRAMDEAQRKPKVRRKKDGIDLEAMADAEIEDMRKRMTDAAANDAEDRKHGRPAMRKLKLLPEVVSLLNKNTLQNSLVDPDLNLLQAVCFFLEPLHDGSLPAYNIQRELFDALGKLPITKDALTASGIGKVVYFYTKTKRAEPGIKRHAEKLVADWTRPILRRNDDYRKKDVAQADYDPTRLPIRNSQSNSQAAIAAAARARALAAPARSNRARVETEHMSYTIAPRSNVVGSDVKQSRNPFTLKLNRGKGVKR